MKNCFFLLTFEIKKRHHFNKQLFLFLFNPGTVSVLDGHSRHKPFNPSIRPPEDRKLKSKKIQSTLDGVTPIECTKDIRTLRIISNDTENDTYFFALLLATAVFSDDVSGLSTRTIVYGTVYLFIRLCYVIAYFLPLQPWRTIAFTLYNSL